MTDIINGIFELFASFFLFINVIKTYKDKKVAGVHWISVAFFTLWGYWNIYFYPHHGLKWSFIAGILVAIINTIWTIQLIYYKGR